MKPHAGPLRLATLLWATLSLGGCWVNPATGKSELSLIDENDEDEIGKVLDQNIVDSIGLHEAPQLAERVELVGKHLAAHSERASLGWTFRVLDEPSVNAFAVPGGHVYVTRGLLAHIADEAELAAVLGHEIGHVTARHSINQISKAHLASRGLGIFGIFSRHGNDAGIREWLLAHGREDELEADDLGVRYMKRAGYDARAMLDTLRMLDRLGHLKPDVTPAHLSTHPATGERLRRQQQNLGDRGVGERRPESFLPLIEGLPVGRDARRGFLVGRRFHHPDANLQVDLPQDWEVWQQDDASIASSPDGVGVVGAIVVRDDDAARVQGRFYEGGEIEIGVMFIPAIGGLPVLANRITVRTEHNILYGVAVFMQRGPHVVVGLGLVDGTQVQRVGVPVDITLLSMQPIADATLRDVQPMRLRMSTLDGPQTLRRVQEVQPSAIALPELAALNNVDPDVELPAGTVVKRVEGFNVEALAPVSPPIVVQPPG